jgi:hypothetical protein
MPSTYTPIATTTLSSAAANYTFSSIPSTYTDLVLVANGSTSSGTENILLRFNGDTATNYSRTRILGSGTAASSERASNSTGVGIGDWGTDRCMVIVNIQNYSNTTTCKSTISRSDTQEYLSAYVGLWRSTAAINSITFYKSSGNINAGTTLTLYGIASA